MKNNIKILFRAIIILIVIAAGVFGGIKIKQSIEEKKMGIGNVIDTYKGVDVHYNGEEYSKNYGKSYSNDGYYYGYKWQCVEYVKRFYKEAKNHKMPDVYGHAKDFYDENVEQGGLNEKRNLLQYKNGGDEKPKEDDLLVFTDTTYGHVVIVSKVGDDYIEVVQQNMGQASRDIFDLKYKDGKYYVGGKRDATCWLRVDE